MRFDAFSFLSKIYNRFVNKTSDSTMNTILPKTYKRNLSRPSINDNSLRLVWVDLEMTGLDVQKDRIMEIACLITDANLTIIDSGLELIIHQSDERLNGMNEWCIEQHGKTGLTEACAKSSMTAEQADDILSEYVQKHTPPGKCCMSGNSIHIDRWFINQYLPKFDKHLHYRHIDVTAVKELAKRWNYDVYIATPPKRLTHRALDDIKDSIDELRYYKSKFLNINI